MFLGFISNIFEWLDKALSGFMANVFTAIGNFWTNLSTFGGQGAYFCFLLIALFLLILILIGLVKLIRKFGLFLILTILLVGIPVLWYFVVFK